MQRDFLSMTFSLSLSAPFSSRELPVKSSATESRGQRTKDREFRIPAGEIVKQLVQLAGCVFVIRRFFDHPAQLIKASFTKHYCPPLCFLHA
jgi:hypothetical protein